MINPEQGDGIGLPPPLRAIKGYIVCKEFKNKFKAD